MMQVQNFVGSVAVMALRRKNKRQPCQMDPCALPLFAWVAKPDRRTSRRRASSQPTKHCADCGVMINRGSRGRCKRCAVIGLKRAIPADFDAVIRRLGSQQAARHYHASLATITRWRRELGFKPQARMNVSRGPRAKPIHAFVQRPLIQNRDMSRAGLAADFLRRYGAVYRCDDNGKPNAKGAFWKRNYAVLTDDELIARATRLGWKGKEW